MINFNLQFENSSDFTEERKDAVRLAASQFGSQFANDATIDLAIESNNSLGRGLMQAGSELTQEPNPGFGNIEVARSKILFGEDLNGSEVDGTVEINWNNNWELEFGETPNEAENEFDFYSTFYHEASHVLGFLSQIDPFGRDPSGQFGPGRSWGAFDEFITDAQGTPIIGDDGALDSIRYNELITGGNSADQNGLFFSGPNVKAANNGNGVGLYTPEQLIRESPTHLDDENPALSGSLMLPFREPGAASRSLSDLEKAMFKDLGYSFDGASEGDNPSDGPSEPSPETTAIKLDSLGSGNTVVLALEQVGVNAVSELNIFKVDDASGQNKQKISSFSILEDGLLPSDYSPSLLVDGEKVSTGDTLQFELEEGGQTRVATSDTDRLNSDQSISLDFGKGTTLTLQSATDSATDNLLLDDAAGIDLSDQSDTVKMEFKVYRDAGLDSTVGFYTTDTAEGAMLDPLTGELLNPGDAGYREAATSRALDTRLTGQNGEVSTLTADIQGNGFLGSFLIAGGTDLSNGELYFSHAGANSNGNDHTKLLGDNTFGFEDLPGLGDRDFNDMVIAFDIV